VSARPPFASEAAVVEAEIDELSATLERAPEPDRRGALADRLEALRARWREAPELFSDGAIARLRVVAAALAPRPRTAWRAQGQPDEAAPERAGDWGAQLHRAPQHDVQSSYRRRMRNRIASCAHCSQYP